MQWSRVPGVVAGTALALLVLLIVAVASAAGLAPQDSGIDIRIAR